MELRYVLKQVNTWQHLLKHICLGSRLGPSLKIMVLERHISKYEVYAEPLLQDLRDRERKK